MNVSFPPVVGPQGPSLPSTKAVGATQGGPDAFAGTLRSALEGVSKLQNESTALQQQFQLGAEGATLEKTMVAMQKSQIAFQAALTVRNRLVGAYTDIMNMQV